MYEIELENGEIINVYEDEVNPEYHGDYKKQHELSLENIIRCLLEAAYGAIWKNRRYYIEKRRTHEFTIIF